ncbi:MAG: DUF3426 domain-containing protein [Deltaproteobacteria bacterium]|nr:MAG: DUF3426 domain-containing protein [Deltaproteobacteria bacterium]
MIIKCPHCETAFNIPDEKISPRGIQAKCYKCSHIFRVRKPESSAPSATPPQPRPPSEPRIPAESPAVSPSMPSGEVQRPLSPPSREDLQDRSAFQKSEGVNTPASPAGGEGPPPFSLDLPVEEETLEESEDLFSEDAATLAANQITPEMKAKLERLRQEKIEGGAARPPSDRQARLSSGKILPIRQVSPPPRSAKKARRRKGYGRAASMEPVRRPLDWFLLLLLTLLFSGGMIFGVRTVRARYGKFEIRDLSYDIVQNRKVGELVILRGVAVNGWPEPMSEIRVRGELLDPQENPVAQQSAYCGNLFTTEELETWDMERIRQHINQAKGEAEINTDLPPSFGIYCMVVFQKPKKRFSRYRMQVIGGPKEQF